MAVQTRELDFDGLAVLDNGRINQLLKKHLQQASADCINRPHDNTARTVTLQFNIVPLVNVANGECEKTQVEVECRSKVPVYRSSPFQMQVSSKWLRFNEDFPDAFDQQPLFADPEPKPVKEPPPGG